ncbi:MAG: hypothetical protein KDI79_22745 [Anaerolineae bacterium]|nr:hypothetical protein [Anaerolineae bacterium]
MTGPKLALINQEKVEAAVLFAVQNIPGVDKATLHKFLEFVNTRNDFGGITTHELLEKMRLLRKYIPSSCEYSLMMLAELLDLHPHEPVFA